MHRTLSALATSVSFCAVCFVTTSAVAGPLSLAPAAVYSNARAIEPAVAPTPVRYNQPSSNMGGGLIEFLFGGNNGGGYYRPSYQPQGSYYGYGEPARPAV